VAHAVRGEERCDRRRAKLGHAIGKEALRSAMLLDGRGEDESDRVARSPAEPLEGDEAAAVVVDKGQDPDGDEAENEDEGEVGAPGLRGGRRCGSASAACALPPGVWSRRPGGG